MIIVQWKFQTFTTMVVSATYLLKPDSHLLSLKTSEAVTPSSLNLRGDRVPWLLKALVVFLRDSLRKLYVLRS